MRRYRVSFDPLAPQAIAMLERLTRIDFSIADFTNEQVWFCCTVWEDDQPAVVTVFEFKAAYDAWMTVAISDPQGLSRRMMQATFTGVFHRASRITAMVRPENRQAMQQMPRMGFQQEGYSRRGYDGIHDAVMWGLLPEDCPCLRGPFPYRMVRQTHPPVMRIQ